MIFLREPTVKKSTAGVKTKFPCADVHAIDY